MTSPTLAADQALDEFRAAVKAREAFGPIDVVASAALGASFRDTRPSAGSAPRRSSSGARAEPPGSVAGSRLRRACVLIVEDVIAAGLSSRESWRALAERPGTVVGAARLIDRSGSRADIGVRRVALATLDMLAYAPDALPLRRFRRSSRGAARSPERPDRRRIPNRRGSDPMTALRLGVNVDHVATVRNARGGLVPDPVRAALLAIEAGADGITAHLREDRRHIHDDDMRRLKASIEKPLNFEMAAAEAMLDIALRIRPHACCIVPEKRTERTTEGGLDVVGGFRALKPYVAELARAGIRVSMFIEPSPEALKASAELGSPVVELHTGAWCDARMRGDSAKADYEFGRLRVAAAETAALGLECHAGHGLDYETARLIAALPQIVELNIGHFLIGEAIFVGLAEAVKAMRMAMAEGRASAERQQ